MNKVILMGHLTRDPEFRQTQSGVSVARFGIAVDKRFKNDKGEYDADFINCVAWRQTAEFVTKYFQKGSNIALTGSINTGSFDDKDGKKVYTTDVQVDEAYFCGDKQDAKATTKKETAPTLNDDAFMGDGFIVDADAEGLPW